MNIQENLAFPPHSPASQTQQPAGEAELGKSVLLTPPQSEKTMCFQTKLLLIPHPKFKCLQMPDR